MTMEVLGTTQGDVVSLSAASLNDTTFASIGSNTMVSLWDVRLKKKNFMTIPTAPSTTRRGANIEATEILYAADHNLVVALCDREIRFVDVRQRLETLAVYTHTSEVVGLLAEKHPCGRDSTLAIDEEGRVFPLDLVSLQPTSRVNEWVFGHHSQLASENDGFGQLSNYCCGLGRLEIHDAALCPTNGSRVMEEAEGAGYGTQRWAVVAVGMDGKAELHRSPSLSYPFEVCLDSLAQDGAAQVVNPPLPACCDFLHDRLVVGKADGTYEVLDLAMDGTSLQTLMAAPGHAHNGLCAVHWLQDGDALLTASLCGQVTMWDIGAFLAEEEGPEQEDACDLPPVVRALDHRECVGSVSPIVNAGVELCRGQYLLCDNEGNVTLSRLD